MNSILDLLQARLADEQSTQVARQLGTDPSTAQQAIQAALPALMAALAGNAQRPEGAASLASALEADHDGSILDDLSGFLDRGDTSDGEGILVHALGDRRATVERAVAQNSGLDSSTVSRLLPLLAPIVMGALGRQKRQSGLDVGGLAGLLAGERQRARQQAPAGLAGVLGGLLDDEGDGLDIGDVADAAGKLFDGLGDRRN
ncbi:MAG: DUF937 domain-containing protein [Gemmatimonadota bacterium]